MPCAPYTWAEPSPFHTQKRSYDSAKSDAPTYTPQCNPPPTAEPSSPNLPNPNPTCHLWWQIYDLFANPPKPAKIISIGAVCLPPQNQIRHQSAS